MSSESTQSIVGYKASPLQERIWKSDMSRASFHCGIWIVLEGALDISRLEDVLRHLVNQHEILRTTLQQGAEMSLPVQVIAQEFEIPVRVRQAAEIAPGAWEFDPRAYYSHKLSQRTQEEGAPFSAELVQSDEHRSDLFLTADSLCCDAASLLLLECSIAASMNGAPHATDEILQYADFAELCETLKEEDLLKQAVRFWEQYPGPSSETGHQEQQRTHALAFQPALVHSKISCSEWNKLRGLSSSLKAELHHLLFYAWQTAAKAYGHVDTAILADARPSLRLNDAIGLYSGFIPLRCAPHSATGLREEVAELKAKLECFEPQQLGYLFNRAMGMESGACFEFHQLPLDLRFGEVNARPGWLHSHQEWFAVKLSCIARSDSAEVLLHYDASVVSELTASRILDSFFAVLASFVHEPEMPARNHSLFPLAEEDRLKQRSNPKVNWDFAEDITLMMAWRVMKAPDSIAIEEDGHCITARELNARANQLARVLRGLGARPEDRVAISLPRSTDLVIAIFSCLKAGVTYIPLDEAFPPARKAQIVRESQALWMITRTSDVAGKAVPSQWILTPTFFEEQRHNYSGADLKSEASSENMAYVIYTSGSTGTPKGVAITRRGLANYLRWAAQYYPSSGAGTPLFLSPAFDLCVTSILNPWLQDERIVIYSGANAFDDLGQDLCSNRTFSLLKITPSHLRLLQEKFGADAPSAPPCDSLVLGGEQLNRRLVEWWRKRWPDTRIFNEYGPTETVVGSTVHEPQALNSDEDVPIGRAIANTRVYLTDEHMRMTPDDVEGELLISGVGVARGYLGRPDLTAEKFVPDVFSGRPGARLYRTGDRAACSDGVVRYLGRADRQVKIRGYRVELAEIESALRTVAGVAEAVVLRVKTKENDGPVLAAFVTRAHTAKAAAEPRDSLSGRLRTALAAHLPEFMVPLYFSVVNSMPLTTSGKVDQEKLEKDLAIDHEQGPCYKPPRNPIEDALALIWAQVLGVQEVGIDDNFFSLGGDSMRSLQVRYKAAQRGLRFELQELFESRTVRRLAEKVTGGEQTEHRAGAFDLISAADRTLIPMGVEDAYPLSRLQMGTLYHSSMPDRPGIYHNINSYHLQVRWDEGAFRQVAARLAARHAILRTAYNLSDFSEPLQLVYSAASVPVKVIDMRGHDATRRQDALREWLNEEAQNAFHWEHPPLLRFFIHLFENDELQFSLSKHHSILDGWSAASMVSEMFNDYLAAIDNEERAIDWPAALYRDFIALECEALRSSSAREFWCKRLAALSVLEIPRQDGEPPAPDFPTSSIATREVKISPETNGALRKIAAELGVPLKDVLLAAHIKMLCLITGQRDIVTGLVSNGRPEAIESDRTLGLFLNSVPVRMRPGNSETWSRLIERVFEEEWRIFPFRRYPMQEMKRDLGIRSLFDTLFYFTNFHVFQQFNEKKHVKAISYAGFEETEMRFTSAFNVHPLSKQLKLFLHFRIGDFSAKQVETITQRYKELLDDMAAGSQRLHAKLPLLSEEEKRQQLEEWNGREEVGEWRGGVLEGIMGVAGRQGDAVAVKCGAETLSYGELVRRSGRIAGWLREEAGGGPERLIGVWVERSVETVVALLGVLQSGAAYVALDAQGPMERCAELIEEAELEWVLMGGKEGRKRKAELERLCRVVEGGEVVREGQRWKGKVEAESLAYVLFTSGSTGRPKGVMVSHQNLATSTWARFAYYGEAAVERYLLLSPLFFDSSVAGLYWTLCSGGCVVIPEEGEQREGGRVAEIVEEERISHVLCIPSLYEVLMEEWEREGKGEGETGETLKVAIVAGEACNAGLVRRHEERLGEVKLCNEYGPTEGTVWSAVSGGEELRGRDPVPIGRGVGTMRSYIEDEEGELLPVGAQGEIVVGGSGVARGYWKQGGVTAERFVPDKWSRKEGERSYRTGDLGRWSGEGQIVFEGRKDDEVKIRGHRISLGEVESVLRRHGGVKEAAAAVVEKGGGRQLVAYVVVQEGETAGREKLREFLCQRLPQAVVPAQIQLVSALPKLPNGKLDRNRLVEEYRSSMPSVPSAEHKLGTETEMQVAKIWSGVFGRKEIGITDDFWDMGGDSIIAMQLAARLKAAFSVDIQVRDIFEARTVARLSDFVARKSQMPVPTEVAIAASGDMAART
jgi:amino acid adenylation domain-containing protein